MTSAWARLTQTPMLLYAPEDWTRWKRLFDLECSVQGLSGWFNGANNVPLKPVFCDDSRERDFRFREAAEREKLGYPRTEKYYIKSDAETYRLLHDQYWEAQQAELAARKLLLERIDHSLLVAISTWSQDTPYAQLIAVASALNIEWPRRSYSHDGEDQILSG